MQLGFLAISGVAGVVAASLAFSRIPESILLPAIVAIFVLSGLSSLIKTGLGGNSVREAKPTGLVAPALISTGLVSSILSGTLGLSGTTPLTSLLIGAFDLDPRMAVGTTTRVTLAINDDLTCFSMQSFLIRGAQNPIKVSRITSHYSSCVFP